MRWLALTLLLAACAASRRDEDAPRDNCWPVFNATHESVWSAARKAAGWTGDVVRVDAADWEIRCADGTVWQVTPWRDPNRFLWVNLTLGDSVSSDEVPVAAGRFFQALDLLQHGQPLPAEAPPFREDDRCGFVSVYPGKGAEHRSDG